MTRQKIFYFMIAFALLMIGAASFFSIFTFGEEAEYITQLKFIKDTGLGAISVFGSIIAIVATAQLLPSELENRTIYTILAKPVHRLEFLLGKYAGAALLLGISVFLMGLLFLGVVALKEQNLTRTTYRETIEFAERGIADTATPEQRARARREADRHRQPLVGAEHARPRGALDAEGGVGAGEQLEGLERTQPVAHVDDLELARRPPARPQLAEVERARRHRQLARVHRHLGPGPHRLGAPTRENEEPQDHRRARHAPQESTERRLTLCGACLRT
jgi:hypothetical protein